MLSERIVTQGGVLTQEVEGAIIGICQFRHTEVLGVVLMLEKDLPEEARAVYRRITSGEDVAPSEATEQLVELGLIEQRRPGEAWVVHDPRAVGHGLMGEAFGDLMRVVERIQRIPAVEALATDYDPHRLYGGPPSEFLPSGQEMNARIGDVYKTASTSVLTAQPGRPTDRDPTVVEVGVQRVVDTLMSGIEVRSLYNSLAAGHDQTAGHVEQIIDNGAEVRAASGVFPRMMIIDDRHLLVENHLVPEAPPNAGWHITDRSTVAWARTVFECFWDRAVQWDMLQQSDAAPVTNERQRQVLQELERGYSLEQAGPRLGIAKRTVTKEMAALRKRLEMKTQFQVMVWWATSPDRTLH